MKQKNRRYKQKTNTTMIDLNLTILIITLNVDELNTRIKKQRVSDWITKKTPK